MHILIEYIFNLHDEILIVGFGYLRHPKLPDKPQITYLFFDHFNQVLLCLEKFGHIW